MPPVAFHNRGDPFNPRKSNRRRSLSSKKYGPSRPVESAAVERGECFPGLFALLNQDRNPARSVAVYPPNGPAFAYTAQNNQPVPLIGRSGCCSTRRQ